MLSALVLLGAVGAFVYMNSRDIPLSERPLDNAPEGTISLLRIDVPGLRRSLLWQKLVVETGRAEGLAALEERCGFDPLEQLHELAMFITGEDSAAEHMGMVARGPFEHERLAQCLQSAAEESSMELERTELEGLPAIQMGEINGQANSRLVFVGQEGLAWGTESLAIATVKAIRGDAPRASGDALLSRLYARVGENREVALVSHVPLRWRQGFVRYIQAQAPERSEEANALLGTQAVAFGARVSRGLSIGVVAVMETGDHAQGLTSLLQSSLDQLMQHPLVAMSPLGGALRRFRITQRGSDVNLAFDLTQERMERLFSLVDSMRGLTGAAQGAAGGALPGIPAGLQQFVPPGATGATGAPGAPGAPGAVPGPVPSLVPAPPTPLAPPAAGSPEAVE